MSYYPNDQEISMVQQDATVYSEAPVGPYVHETSTNQFFQPSMHNMPYADVTDPNTVDWWLWSDLLQSDSDLMPQQDNLHGTASPEAAVSSNSHDHIEQLSQKIIALEFKLSRLDELERRCDQLQEAEQRLGQIEEMQYRLCEVELATANHYVKFVTQSIQVLRLLTHVDRSAEEKVTLGLEVKAHVEKWAEQIKMYVEGSRKAISVE
jgi:hypothetical protein